MHVTYIYAHTTHYLKHIVTQNTHTKRTLPTTVKPPHSESIAMYRVENMTSPLLSSFLSSSPSYSTSYNPHRSKKQQKQHLQCKYSKVQVVIQSHRPSLRQPKTLRTQSQTTTRLNFPPPPNPKSRPKEIPLLSQLCPNPALPTPR